MCFHPDHLECDADGTVPVTCTDGHEGTMCVHCLGQLVCDGRYFRCDKYLKKNFMQQVTGGLGMKIKRIMQCSIDGCNGTLVFNRASLPGQSQVPDITKASDGVKAIGSRALVTVMKPTSTVNTNSTNKTKTKTKTPQYSDVFEKPNAYRRRKEEDDRLFMLKDLAEQQMVVAEREKQAANKRRLQEEADAQTEKQLAAKNAAKKATELTIKVIPATKQQTSNKPPTSPPPLEEDDVPYYTTLPTLIEEEDSPSPWNKIQPIKGEDSPSTWNKIPPIDGDNDRRLLWNNAAQPESNDLHMDLAIARSRLDEMIVVNLELQRDHEANVRIQQDTINIIQKYVAVADDKTKELQVTTNELAAANTQIEELKALLLEHMQRTAPRDQALTMAHEDLFRTRQDLIKKCREAADLKLKVGLLQTMTVPTTSLW